MVIQVSQTVGEGETRDDRAATVAVEARRKLGRALTIAKVAVEELAGGAIPGGLELGEELELICAGEELAQIFAPKPKGRPRHRATPASRGGSSVATWILRGRVAAAPRLPRG